MSSPIGFAVNLKRDAPVYLDANVLIYALESQSEDGLRARECLIAIDRGDLVGVTSELTLVEVLPHPLRSGNRKLVDGYRQVLGAGTRLRVVPTSRNVLERAAAIRAEHANATPDAIHVATAVLQGCPIFLTNDNRLRVPSNMTRISLADFARLGS